MYDVRKGDVIVTVDGDILKVRRSSSSWVYGENITKNDYFMISRNELNKRIKEVFYV
jgi:hypothetical protein